MKCCEHCFEEGTLQGIIRDQGEKGFCDFCGASRIAVVEASTLNKAFEGLLSLYEPVEFLEHFDDSGPEPSDIGDSLPCCIQDDGWGVFNEESLTSEKQCELLDEIRRGNHYYKDLFTSSSELWISSDRRLWHLTEEETWKEFCDHIKYKRRFILGDDSPVGIVTTPKDRLPPYLERIETTLSSKTELYRARINRGGDLPYPAGEMGAPPSEKATAGRVNSEGIPVLYAAFDKDTAVGEMRSSVGTKITVARLNPKRDLKVVDLHMVSELPSPFAELPEEILSFHQLAVQTSFIHCLNKALSEPIHVDTSRVDYVPTQYVAEVIKSVGYDGIIYGSSIVSGGRNIVVFDTGVVEVQEMTELIEITDLKCKYRVVG